MKRKIFAVVMAVAMMTMATASLCFADDPADSYGTAQIVLTSPSSSNIVNNDPDNIKFTVSEKITVTAAATDTEPNKATVSDLVVTVPGGSSGSASNVDVKSIVVNNGADWALFTYDPDTFATYSVDLNRFAMKITDLTNDQTTTQPNADLSPSGYVPTSAEKTINIGKTMTVKFAGLITKTSAAQTGKNIGTCVVTVAKATV
jgi:hypothetical protein